MLPHQHQHAEANAGSQIVYNEFPLPSIPLSTPGPPTIDPEVVASTPPAVLNSDPLPKDEDLPDADDENELPPNSQSSSKENEEPSVIRASRPPVPPFDTNRSENTLQFSDSIETQSGTLPPDLLSLYTSSRHVLEKDFAHSPPYTIQRLAELALYPKKYYRFLPAYLRALDRIVSVSSPVSDFPLPSLYPTLNGGFLTNGDVNHANGHSENNGLGSDESLGGALLTPIPWLRNNALGHLASQSQSSQSQNEGEIRSERTETIEGPNGAGSIETVSVTVNGIPSATSLAHTSPAQPNSPTLSEQSDASSSSSSGPTEAEMREQGAVTQGELLRQEQEAGVIPVNQSIHGRSLLAGGAAAVGREPVPGPGHRGTLDSIEDRPPAEETPHARGPDEIGPEDMGPQHAPLDAGLDMEAAVGRGRSKSPQPPPMAVESSIEATMEAEAADADHSGESGQDPKDVEKDVEMVREGLDDVKEADIRAEEGDVVLADPDGVESGERDEMEVTNATI